MSHEMLHLIPVFSKNLTDLWPEEGLVKKYHGVQVLDVLTKETDIQRVLRVVQDDLQSVQPTVYPGDDYA